MSEPLIASLQEQITRLQADNATLRAEAKDRRIKGRTLKEENERFASALEELAAERDRYKEVLEAEPHELQAQVDEYRGKLRDRDHKDKFRALAKTAGVNEAALDDLYSLSGYKPEADDIDESKITAAITSTLSGRDRLRAAPAAAAANGKPAGSGTAAAQGAAPVTREPGPGAIAAAEQDQAIPTRH